MLEYETANPGQDFDEKESAAFDPERDLSRPSPVVQIATGTEPIPSSHGDLAQMRGGSIEAKAEYQREPTPTTASGSRGSGSRKAWLTGPAAMKEGKREVGYSPQAEADRKAEADLSYQAGPDVESGSHGLAAADSA